MYDIAEPDAHTADVSYRGSLHNSKSTDSGIESDYIV